MLSCSGDSIGEATLGRAGAVLALQQQPLSPSTDFNLNNLQWLPTARCCLKMTELAVILRPVRNICLNLRDIKDGLTKTNSH